MKHFYWSLLLVACLVAPASAAARTAKTAKKQTKKAEEKKEAKTESPAPSPAVEKAISGLIELGYRGMTSVRGDQATYRSVVNNRTGLRLTAMELNFTPEKSRFLDEARLQVHNWGDPYNTARLEIGKRGLWRYSGRYSNMFYYNNLPSFANANAPGLYTGDQRAMDTSVRNYDNRLEFLPGRIITPYVGYQKNSSRGTGVTPLVLDGNDYPLRTNIAWQQNTLFAGVRVTMRRAHATIEQGHTSFNDNQYVYSTEALNGSRLAPVLGQTQLLKSGSESYIVRGRGPYTRVYGSGSITNFLDLTGTYVHSRPEMTAGYNMTATGALFVPSLLTLYPGQVDSSFGSSQAPHTLAGVSAEVHASIIRIRHTWETDRYETRTARAQLSRPARPTH
jgi:hypothetical protein